jgi:transaldolase
MKPLLRLIDYGQSYWLDNLSRKMILNGELEKRVSNQGLRGMTSNPSIFNNAISKSDDYDEQIARLVKEGKSTAAIYEALTVKDVQDACDILRPVYNESKGVDGYVSLEVSPYLAQHAEATMTEARYLFKTVNRPNLLIKIPGTDACLPAIEQMLYEGVNINITLLFSIESYEDVARAYINALERRINENKPVQNVASVASFFLSRIDVLTDQLLMHQIPPGSNRDSLPHRLLGQAAVASAKIAYQSFQNIFSGKRWEALTEKGARVQRPLWASTSTKNPEYSDVKYVEPLIGYNTVNTMPEETIAAFADHGIAKENTIEENIDRAHQVLSDLKKVGIDIDKVTWQLVNDGIQKFIDPFSVLMNTISHKRQQFIAEKV